MLRSVMVPVDFSANVELVLRFSEGLVGPRRSAYRARSRRGRGRHGGPGHRQGGRHCPRQGSHAAGGARRCRSRGRGSGSDRERLRHAALDRIGVPRGSGRSGHSRQGCAQQAHPGLGLRGHRPELTCAHDDGPLRRASVSRTIRAKSADGFGRSILLPTDFSASSMRALMSVFEMLPKSVGTLYLLHVVRGGSLRRQGAQGRGRCGVPAAQHGGHGRRAWCLGPARHQERRSEARDLAGGQRASRLRDGRRFARSESASGGHARQSCL